MKIEWQEEDIKGGRIVAKPGRTERWMIGYFGDGGKGGEFALVSMLDGMICQRLTRTEMTAALNKSRDYPGEFVDAYEQQTIERLARTR